MLKKLIRYKIGAEHHFDFMDYAKSIVGAAVDDINKDWRRSIIPLFADGRMTDRSYACVYELVDMWGFHGIFFKLRRIAEVKFEMTPMRDYQTLSVAAYRYDGSSTTTEMTQRVDEFTPGKFAGKIKRELIDGERRCPVWMRFTLNRPPLFVVPQPEKQWDFT